LLVEQSFDSIRSSACGVGQRFVFEAPAFTMVRVSAENDIPAQVLISTLDALRGSDCRLRLVTPDEAPSECLFFQPVVQAR
jgi:hypothetical protein